jgi:hypothetical protein
MRTTGYEPAGQGMPLTSRYAANHDAETNQNGTRGCREIRIDKAGTAMRDRLWAAKALLDS